jgi:RHS repeat-associated protein
MKKYLLFFIVAQVMVASALQAQTNTPNGVTNPASAISRTLPYVDEVSLQYQRSFVPVVPLQNEAAIRLAMPIDSAVITTQYFDYLHRPLQSVTKQASPNKKDYVAPAYFDEFGRPSTQYLPYVAQTGNADDGKFKGNMYRDDSAFYKSIYPNENINYAQQLYDGSPLNRVLKSMAVGNSFTGSNIGKTISTRANTLADSVVLWTIPIVNEDDVPVKYGIYAAGTLMIQELTDEKGIKVISYTDEQGKTILVKKQLATTPAAGHSGWLCTYYVYDEMGSLRLMLPPKAVEALAANSWVLSTAVLNGYCYSYFYDTKGRNTIKRIPGKGKFYTAYDLLNRVVMSQDPKLRATNQWAFVLYDEQDRPVKSGLITSALTKDVILAQAAASMSYPTLSGTYTITSESYYDDYSWIAATGAALPTTLNTTNINATNFNTNYNTAPEYAQPIVQSKRIRGAATGSKKLILNSNTYLYSVTFYDDNGRAVQSATNNYSGGTDISTVQYSYASKMLRTHAVQQKAGTNAQTHTLLTKMEYDHGGRVKTIKKTFDNVGEKTLSQFTYNELGQVQTKTISPTGGAGGTALETQTFAYNIQGALVSINAPYVTTPNTGGFFGEIISYEYGFTTSQANGAISGVRWKAAGDGIARAYGYTYDNANRLTYADFNQQNEGSTTWAKNKVDYTVSNLTYDANGNILTQKQRALQLVANTTIDSLTYQYFANSNQLQKVTDGITDLSPLGDFKDTTSTTDDYAYDVNGNIIKDNNRHMHTATGAAGASFNILDKPDSIIINGKSKTYYTYDAGGSLLRKQVLNLKTNTTSNYLYIGAFIYKNDTLQTVFTEEGQIRKGNNTEWAFDYFIKDHQGNIRTILTDATDSYYYLAGMEPSRQAIEDALFTNVYSPVSTVVAKPAGFDNSTRNTQVSRLNGNTSINKKTGPGIVLKVMAGDKLYISCQAFYNTATQPPLGGVNILSEVVNALTGGVVTNSGGKVTPSSNSTVSGVLNNTANVPNFLNTRTYDPARPKAFLNWILVDNQFNIVTTSGASNAIQVLAGTGAQALVAPTLTMPKNGYLYVYVSNESPQDVYFDNIAVQHLAGPLVQEQSYYPFGLPMAAISDKAALKANTPYKYNAGAELEDDGIDYYNTFYRKYDAQIGRFTGVDMYADMYADVNPYQYAVNNPVLFNDPDGDKIPAPGGKVQMWSVGRDGTTRATWLNDMLFPQDEVFGGDMFFGGGGYGGGGNYAAYWAQLYEKGMASSQDIVVFKSGINPNNGMFGFWHSERGVYTGEGVGVTGRKVWEYFGGGDGSRGFGGLGTKSMQTGDRGQRNGWPLQNWNGNTITDKQQTEHEYFNNLWAGRARRVDYTSIVSGNKGKIVTINQNYQNGAYRSTEIKVGPFALQSNNDMSTSIKVKAELFGVTYQAQMTFSPFDFNEYTWGSYAEKDGLRVGTEYSYQPRAGTLLAAVGVVLFGPELLASSPGWGSVLVPVFE